VKSLLIYPEYPATFWSFKYALKFIRKRAALPPLGLLTVGAMIFLREYKRPKVRVHLDFQRLLAVFRSNVRLGIFGRERFQYWKILFWTLFRRPQFIGLAITLAIYGHHFRKICELKIAQ
jgi:hypothetical protein